MKSFIKKLSWFFLSIFLIIGVYTAYNYYPDLPVEDLIEKYAFEDSQFIEMDGLNVHYRKTGQGHPFVLIHGFGANLWNWEEWTDLLNDNYQVISLDLPGFGLTGPTSKRDYSTATQVTFLNNFLEKIGVDTFYLAGNSMGGNISWNYTLQYPEKVKKLILLNSSGYPKEGDGIIGFKLIQTPIVKDLVVKITPKSLVLKTLKDAHEDDKFATESLLQFYHDIMRRTGNRQALVDRMSEKYIDNSSLIPNISTPTLIIWGEKDLVIPVGMAHKFQEDLPNSELIVYENIGHLPMVEIPEQTVEDVMAFINNELKFHID